MTRIDVSHHGLHLRIETDAAGRLSLSHLGTSAPAEAATVVDPGGPWTLFQLHGEQPEQGWVAATGGTHRRGEPGMQLVYGGHEWIDQPDGGRRLEIRSGHGDFAVTSILRFPAAAPAFQIAHRIVNRGSRPVALLAAPSLSWRGVACGGSRPWDERFTIHRCDNNWFAEMRWQSLAPREAGIVRGHPKMGSPNGMLMVGNVGSASTKRDLPMGIIEDHELGCSLAWQIEHSGGWEWQLADDGHGLLSLIAGGPNDRSHHWWMELRPGQEFATVPVGMALAVGDHQAALRVLTTYRRAIRRPHPDNRALPIIFNDYMNCLMGDPTTERELPLIAAAAKAGCEIFVIDAGWYAERNRGWWDTVGAWEESPDRFGGKLVELLQRIREAGMVPGLWLELEVMGVNCPLVKAVPREWFFQRHGRPLVFAGRHQLDFRHPGVRAHADRTVDRLVSWGCGYIKMDYNIDSGPGTDLEADSAGDGAIRHMRAYWAWLEGVYDRHPGLVIENCSSGGQRMDYGQLTRHSVQSSSDQEDWRLTPYIAAAGPTGATPEQQAVWSYPMRDGTREETVCNMVSAILQRVHQSGHLAELSAERFAAVADGLAVYRSIRHRLPTALPYWPWGLPRWGAPRCALALADAAGVLVAVWRLGDPQAEQTLDFPHLVGVPMRVRCLYPAGEAPCSWDARLGRLTVSIPPDYGARLFSLDGASPTLV